MSRFVMKSKATKEAAKKAKEKGGGFNNFKMNKRVARLLILPPVADDKPAVFTSVVHELWKNKRPVAKVASPSFSGQPDKIAKTGWAIRDIYKEDSNKKKKEYFKNFLPKESHYVNVLDLDDIDAGPQVYQMSGAVAETVLDEINDSGGELESICDFDEGRILQVKTNGKEGLQKRYKAKFLADTANLLEDGVLTEDDLNDIADNMADLTKMQPKFDEDAYENLLETLLKAAEKNGIDIEATGDEDEEGEDEFEEADDNDGFEDDDFEDDLDVDGEEEDDFEDDDGEEESEEEDDDGFEDDDFDLDEEEEEKPKKKAKKSSKKAAKKVAKKSTEKAAKKKSSTRTSSNSVGARKKRRRK